MNSFLNPQKNIIRGYSRDLLMDFDDNSTELLPKTFFEYLESGENTFEEYEEFIEEKRIRICNKPNENKDWDFFSHITNAKILVYNTFPQFTIDVCNGLIIEAVELLFCSAEEKKVIETLAQFGSTYVKSLELVFSDCQVSSEFLDQISHHHLVHKITILNQKESKKEIKNKEGVPVLFHSSISSLIREKQNDLSIINYTLFTESQLHHTYFNRKLYIGPNGEIKNAPECEEEFGTIQDLKNEEELKEIIATPEFQKYWYVHKEITDVCKECEFRHMCVDNRLPYQRKQNEWYHKQECNYNPYIAKWQGEEGYKTLAECGVVSNEKEYNINHEKIAEINKELWDE